MFPVPGCPTHQPAKTVSAFAASDKNPVSCQRVVNSCSDMFIRMFLHQFVLVMLNKLLTGVNGVMVLNYTQGLWQSDRHITGMRFTVKATQDW